MINSPTVTLVAHTWLERWPDNITKTEFVERRAAEAFGRKYATDAETLVEFAGRACYQSWSLPNPKTADNDDYIANILSQQHFSVLEHASATFYLEGVSRALTHELIRHRHLSVSELSQRFVDMKDVEFVTPPLTRAIADEKVQDEEADIIRRQYAEVVKALTEAFPDATRKQIRETARAMLPNMTETKIVVTGNLRAWRDMLHKRYSVHADAEICDVAGLILEELRTIAPSVFADFPEEPFQ